MAIMNTVRRAGVMLVFAICWGAGLSAQLHAQDAAAKSLEFFEKEVRPLLVKRCYECHSGTKTSGGLALDSRAGWQKGGETGPVILPGKPDESLLINAINYRSVEMPPKDQGGKLTAEEIQVLTEWVRLGAPDPREQVEKLGGMSRDEAKSWWSFQPLPPTDGKLTSARIDELLDASLAEQGLQPNPPTDKRTLIRRVSYDLTGLPPSSAEVEAFEADDSPEAFANVIERLLASPQYGVKWGRHWLDVVRYADTAGENTDRPLPHAWRYRNWVFDAFNRDLPFDDFIRLQLAGDVLRAAGSPEERREGVIATGYLAIARRFGHDIDKDIHLMFEDVIDNVGKNFLGLTTGCARCHDHKYDPITSEDYYALYGIFQSSRFSFPGCEPKGQPRDMVPLLPLPEIESLMKPWRERVAQAEAEQKRRNDIVVPTAKLKELAEKSVRRLAAGKVGEGADIPLLDEQGQPLKRIAAKQGEVFQLTIHPNENHGADTTRLEWTIQEVGAGGTQWSLADLVDSFLESNPHAGAANAQWCFLESTNGPEFLTDRHGEIQGNGALKSWCIGDLPSVFVNVSDQPVAVWTSLPAKSLFVHPGPQRPVAVAWVCPHDGEFDITGRVIDGHPAGLDGVSFQMDHLRSAEFGKALVGAGRILSAPVPDPGPAPAIPVAYAVVEAEAKHARVHLRGNHELLGEEVPRRWLSIFGGAAVPADAGSGRRQLADWIASHPLAARVMVNRIWQGHFGQGLVRSPNDFGSRGERPTHPELLDRLAAQFTAGGYHIKEMHRLIMQTAAYQRSSARSQELVDRDPENRLLCRFPRRRLTAEEIRDSLLLAGGNLDLQPGEAHPFPPEATWSFSQHAPFNAMYDTNRRSAYLMMQRQRRHPYLTLFDGADTNSSTATRQTTTVPTQALYFMNDPFFHAQAASLAAVLLNLPDDSKRVPFAFRQLFQRDPSTIEQTQAAGFLQVYPGTEAEKWAAYARVLLAGNEFLHVD